MLYKRILKNQVNQYTDNGWGVTWEQPSGIPSNQVQVELNDGAPDFTLEHTPAFLIQRCKIRRPLSFSQHRPLPDAIDLDHMGYPELTTVQFSQMLRRMRYHFFDYSIYRRDDIALVVDTRKYALRVFSYFEGDVLNAYLDELREIQLGQRQTLAPTYFNNQYTLPKLADCWIDVANDVIFSYDRQFMNRLVSHLEASLVDGPTRATPTKGGVREKCKEIPETAEHPAKSA